MGAGTIGLLATLVLRLRGLEVTAFGRSQRPYLNSDLLEAIGARYESTAEVSVLDGARKHGPFDLIFEATGSSPVVFDSMQGLAKNGVLVLSSVTGGDRKVEVPADRIAIHGERRPAVRLDLLGEAGHLGRRTVRGQGRRIEPARGRLGDALLLASRRLLPGRRRLLRRCHRPAL